MIFKIETRPILSMWCKIPPGEDTNMFTRPDYIVEMHKYSYENLNKGCTLPEMVAHLKSIGLKADEPPLNNSVIQIFGQIFVDSYKATTGYTQGDARYWMQSEAYFRYLDYIEMRDAQENAKQATKIAIWAIIISGALALGQIITSLIP